MANIHEIRVAEKGVDTRGADLAMEAARSLGITDITVRTANVYRVEGVRSPQARKLARDLFTDPITQESKVDKPLFPREGDDAPSYVLEVGYKPGVMNPAVTSIEKAASALGILVDAVDTSREYAFYGDVTGEQVNLIAERLLVNKTVERVITEKPKTLKISGEVGPVEIVPVRNKSKEELMELSKDKLFLNEEEMGVIQQYFEGLGREPTDCELEILAGWWSEHCGHKTFKAKVEVNGKEKPPLYTRIKDTARKYFDQDILSAFNDNSGVMRFYDGMAIAIKVETHNSPSAIEPYGGAMTGSGGVFRDILGTGQGAKNIISTDKFCFAPPDLDPSLLPDGTLSPDYLYRKVVAGVRDYGNRMGIPTNNGSVHFHEDFRAKPTVIVGAAGILPEEYSQKGEPHPHDLVVVIGGRTGRDGIHGATFSSAEMTERTVNVNSSAVQIGNAIEEKRMSDGILEARDKGLIRAITDCGAAGFSSAIGELGSDTGVTVDISKAPLKYPGLSPWEIWMSESQERMVVAVAPDKIDDFLKVQEKYNVEATVLGSFDSSNKLTVMYGDQQVANLDYDFLKNGLPQRIMQATYETQIFEEQEIPLPESNDKWVDAVKKVLSHGNVCSKEPIVRQYDHTVQGAHVVTPFGGVGQEGPNDAVVISPILNKPYGMIVAHGMNPILNRIDPYEGSKWAVAEATANLVAVGGDPNQAVLVNNYIWPFPDEVAMGSLDRSVDGVTDCMDALKRPVISGKDSLSSTYRGKDGKVIKIPPVLCMTVMGKIPDVSKTVTSDLKKDGSSLYLVGALDDNMGGSTYFDTHGLVGNTGPTIDLEMLPKVLKGVHQAIKNGEVYACHDVSEGGVIGAVSEMAFGGDCGVELTLEISIKPDKLLFNETAGTFVVELPDDETAKRLFGELPHMKLGMTKAEKSIAVNQGDHALFSASVDELKEAWQNPMRELFH